MSFFYRKSVKLGPFPRHKSCPESHGGFDFESAEVLHRSSAQRVRLSEIPQLPQSLAELSQLWAVERDARSELHGHISTLIKVPFLGTFFLPYKPNASILK
jgi:hypothetical protein